MPENTMTLTDQSHQVPVSVPSQLPQGKVQDQSLNQTTAGSTAAPVTQQHSQQPHIKSEPVQDNNHDIATTSRRKDNSNINKRSGSETNDVNKDPPKPKRRRRNLNKKVSRACNHCRKAHMTCDESRPCKRCVNRGLAATCVDAPRKTKKYLLETDLVPQPQPQHPQSEAQVLSQGQAPVQVQAGPGSGAVRSIPMSNAINNGTNNETISQNSSTIASNVSVVQLPPHLQQQQLQQIKHEHQQISQASQVSQVPQIQVQAQQTGSGGPGVPPDQPPHHKHKTIQPLPHQSYIHRPPQMAHSQSLSLPDASQRSNSNSSTNNGGPIATTTPNNNNNQNNENNSNGSNSSGHGAFLSSAADLEYAILGNIIQTHDFMSPEQHQFMSPSLSASNSDDVEYLNYQPLMLQSQGTNGSIVGTNRTPQQQQQLTQQQLIQQHQHQQQQKQLQQQASQIQKTTGSNSVNATVTTSADDAATHSNIPGSQQQQSSALFNNGYQQPTPTQLQIQQQQASTLHATQQQIQQQQQQQQVQSQAQAQTHQLRTGKTGATGGKISDIYSAAPRCDATTNQYFIGTMMTIDGIKTFTFPEVVKLISLFKKQNPLEFKSRNRRSAISFSVGVLNDQTDDLCLISSSSNANAITNDPSPTSRPNSIKSSVSPQQPQHAIPHNESSHQQRQQSQQKPKPDPMRISNLMKHNAKITPCGLKYEEPSQIYKHIQTPFSYVKPYHDLNVYLKKRFDKNHLISVSRSIAEYRPSFIAATYGEEPHRLRM
ncbi:unnamed protein product [Ambrosiozyma monospora]|uniref:Transcription activator of gluconeogenesis ERT1 n=1 Tax=Ambrosiozyma monospora TaxID=43982 RepID=A0A9W6YVW0_AMBMO|nr:unnamed protein product [Ambrosiozyma monospora]